MADDTSALTISFGKHAGKTVAEVLVQDPQYADWLVGQGWFADRFAELHKAITNRGAGSDDSPAHNAIQLKFLKEEFCLAFFAALNKPALIAKLGPVMDNTRKHVIHRRFRTSVVFETYGMDVIVCADAVEYFMPEDKFSEENFDKYGKIFKDAYWNTEYVDRIIGAMYSFVEIKPSIGDDFPSILRQLKMLEAPRQANPVDVGYARIDPRNSGGKSIRCLYDNYVGSANVADVASMFKASGHSILALADVESQLENSKKIIANIRNWEQLAVNK